MDEGATRKSAPDEAPPPQPRTAHGGVLLHGVGLEKRVAQTQKLNHGALRLLRLLLVQLLQEAKHGESQRQRATQPKDGAAHVTLRPHPYKHPCSHSHLHKVGRNGGVRNEPCALPPTQEEQERVSLGCREEKGGREARDGGRNQQSEGLPEESGVHSSQFRVQSSEFRYRERERVLCDSHRGLV